MKMPITKAAYRQLQLALQSHACAHLPLNSYAELQKWTAASSKASLVELTGFVSENIRRLLVGRLIPKNASSSTLYAVVVQFTNRPDKPESAFYAYVVGADDAKRVKDEAKLSAASGRDQASMGSMLARFRPKGDREAPMVKFGTLQDIVEERA